MKNKGLSLLLLLLGGAAVYYYVKNSKKKLKGSVIVDPLDKGEFVLEQTKSVEDATKELNSSNSVNISILEQIQKMNEPTPVITYQKYYKPDLDAANPEQTYQSFYATINGKRVGVPYLL